MTLGIPSLLAAATNHVSQLFTLTALPVAITASSDLPRRVFAGPAHYAIESVVPNSTFGEAVSVGDFNGDGRLELAVGLSRFKVKRSQVGKVGVFAFPSPGVESQLVSHWIGGLVSVRSGAELASGDVNGDGNSDLLVSAVSVSGAQRHIGMTKLFSGGRTGLAWEPAWDNLRTDSSAPRQKILVTDMNRDGFADVIIGSAIVDKATGRGGGAWLFPGSSNGLSRQPTWSVRPATVNSSFGAALVAADVNGDGWSDLLVGAPDYGAGAVDVFYGSPEGLAKQPSQVLAGRSADIRYGSALTEVGDLNGDGCADVVVGAPGAEKNGDWPGEAYLHFGSPTGLVSATEWRAMGWRAASAFGSSVAGVGDVNGDGRPDLLIGAPGLVGKSTIPGRVSLWLGGSKGFSSNSNWEVTADVNFTRLGAVVMGAGDLDGDGMNDFIITSPNQTARGTTIRVGRVDVFRGLKSGYGSGETFPVDGVVCLIGDQTVESRLARAKIDFASATNVAVKSIHALGETRRQARIHVSVMVGVACALSSLAFWLWWNRRRVRAEVTRRERERIARDLHDGLGSGVHRLQRLTELLNRVAPESDAAISYRDELLRTAQQLGGSMNQAIWSIKPGNDTLEHMVEYIASYAPSVVRSNGIECEMDLPGALPAWPLSGDARQHLFLAVNEALHNAVKHARARQIWVRVTWSQPWLEIIVEDDGCGMADSTAREKGGNGLENLRARLGLLNGSAKLLARDGGGTRVMLRLPL